MLKENFWQLFYADGRFNFLWNLSKHLHVYTLRVTDVHDPSIFVCLCGLSFHVITSTWTWFIRIFDFLKNYCFSSTPSQPFLRSRMRNCLLKAKCICCCELQNMELSCIQHVRLQNVGCFYTKKWFIHTVRVQTYKMMSCRTAWKRLSGMLIVLSVFTCTATWRVVQTGNWGLIRSPLCHCFW